MHSVFHVVFGYVFYVCDCVIVCYKLRGKTYTRYDVYGKCDCVVITQEKYIYMVKCIWEKWNPKVRNHNIRGSENEMNQKVLNFVEINKKEWLAISTT